KEFNVYGKPARALRERSQRAHHAVDLRMPGVGCDQDPHQRALDMDGSATGWSNRAFSNRMRHHCRFISQSCDGAAAASDKCSPEWFETRLSQADETLVPPISSSCSGCSKLVKELEIEKRH